MKEITIKKIENKENYFIAYFKNPVLQASFSVCFPDTVCGAVALNDFFQMLKVNKMTLEEAVKLWVNRDFSNISTMLIKRAFKDNYEELELLSSEFPELDYPAGWGWMFHPECSLDEKWITDTNKVN